MGPLLIVVGWLLILGSGAYLFLRLKKAKKDCVHSFEKKDLQLFVLLLIVCGLGGVASNFGYKVAGNWPMEAGHIVLMTLGALLFYPSVLTFLACFYLRYWRRDFDEKQRKTINVLLFASIPAMLVFFLLGGEGLAPYLTYPLSSGFAINDSGFVWMDAAHSTSGGLQIAWYGVIIVGAAILAYRISDHHLYLKYGRHGIVDTCFIFAFLAGILGARIWYVVGNWNGDGAGGPNFSQYFAEGRWYEIFSIWKGGLTILGGAVGGILGGMAYMLLRRKYVDIRVAFDLIVPTILIAQAIGRWGNFFNHEVYGAETAMANWPLLPTWIKYQMATGWNAGSPVSGNMYVPLFLIEGIINLIGYFVIYWGIPKIWKKGRALGDGLGFYLIWYGITRMIMEPLRDPSYNMGSNGMWSFWNSMVYVLLGLAVVIGMQVFAYLRKKKGLPEEMGGPKPDVAEPVVEDSRPRKIEKKDDLSAPAVIKKKDESDGEA